MARSNNSDPAESARATATALHERLAELQVEREALADARAAAITRNAMSPGDAATVAEIARLGASIATLDQDIAGNADALDRVRMAEGEITQDQEAAGAAAMRARLATLARAARKRATAIDEAADMLIAALREGREATKGLWEASDGPTRREGLGELPRLLSDLPMVIYERLAHGDVFASRSAAFDRSAAAPSVEGHLDIALREIAPPPGRPKNAEPAADEAAARAAIEKDIAA